MKLNLALQILIFWAWNTENTDDAYSGKGVKLGLWLAPSTSTPKTTVKNCEESESCYAHNGPFPNSKNFWGTGINSNLSQTCAHICQHIKILYTWTTAKFTPFLRYANNLFCFPQNATYFIILSFSVQITQTFFINHVLNLNTDPIRQGLTYLF